MEQVIKDAIAKYGLEHDLEHIFYEEKETVRCKKCKQVFVAFNSDDAILKDSQCRQWQDELCKQIRNYNLSELKAE